MELGYVRKHCLSTQADDRFWKVLDTTMEAAPKADVLVENSGSSSVEVNVTSNAASEEFEMQLPKTSSNKDSVLILPPPRKKPAITLFGRARLGYHSCISVKETKASCVEENYTPSPILDSGLKGPLLSLPKEALYASRNVNNDPECLLNNQNMPLRDISITSCVEDDCKQKEVEHKLPFSDDKENIVEKAKENNVEAIDADSESDTLRRDATVGKSVSYSHIRSSNGYSDNFRKLYRSLNVPAPRPLPSLVKLMESCKRAKRQFEI